MRAMLLWPCACVYSTGDLFALAGRWHRHCQQMRYMYMSHCMLQSVHVLDCAPWCMNTLNLGMHQP